MPGLARKLVICAAVDGIVIQPLPVKGQRPFQPVRVRYGDASISSIPRDQIPGISESGLTSFEAFGVIGLITVSNLSYLVTITRRQQVAQICGFPVYAVTEVAVTPCSSKQEAEGSIRSTADLLQSKAPQPSAADVESSDEDVDISDETVDEVDDDALTGDSRPDSSRSSIAEDVMRRRGSYGRFAQRWFSQSGWTLDQRRTLGLSNRTDGLSPETTPAPTPMAVEPPTHRPYDMHGPVSTLLPKLLHTVRLLFGSSRSFYFSYDVDITHNLAKKSLAPDSETPLYAQADDLFLWNRHIMQPFLEAGQDSLALPLMQGFVGQRSFVVDSEPPQVDEPAKESLELHSFSPQPLALSSTAPASESVNLRPSQKTYLITLISRRSTKRAGLRYLRRGVNEDGFTANMVETEQLLSSPTWDASTPVRSFLQIRGSIPLFFTQSAYALKPVPSLQHSAEANYKACKRHFERLSKNYGALQVVNLVEKQGIEEPLGTQYQKNVDRLNEESVVGEKIPFEWFDFHHACRGMKFENVSHLLLSLKGRLEDLGSTTRKNEALDETQKGVLRTNCMDCLDRTNVCQSSFAKHMLDVQLKEGGIDMSAQVDQVTSWFNTLWADNGDAVSKQYASTSAMKGDYTRTRKRDYRGALNDLGLSLARLYSGMVNDYFSQTAIDFLLGNVTAKVFDEFETDMMTKDPAVSVPKMRERAVELCQKRVVADVSEEFHGGWVLVSPNSANVVKSWPMEEVVLLLTDAALYLCRFDWDLDKVSSFDRVQLANITHIKFGTYITSTIATSHVDEERNVGFVISYQPGKSDITRTNTRTLSTRDGIVAKPPAQIEKPVGRPLSFTNFFASKPRGPTVRQLAFKAPYTDYSTAVAGTGPRQSEIQEVVTICAEVERLAFEMQLLKDGETRDGIIEKGDIISLEAAKRNTGLLEQLGHSIKKLVWA